MKPAWVLMLGALAVAAAGCSPRPNADTFGEQVHAYLLQHPEVIEEAYAKGQEQKEAKVLAAAQSSILKHKAELESDPRDFVANPGGKVTVVEFFDYRCPYCKAALPAMMDLIGKNKDVRFVFKEFPILDKEGTPGVSRRASLAALAAKGQGKYLAVHKAMMGAHPLGDAEIVAALGANGIAAAPALADRSDADKQLADTFTLATTIGVSGTPSFVVNGKLIPGADMEALNAAIAGARKAKG